VLGFRTGVEPVIVGLRVGVTCVGLFEVGGLLVVITGVVVRLFPVFSTSSKSWKLPSRDNTILSTKVCSLLFNLSSSTNVGVGKSSTLNRSSGLGGSTTGGRSCCVMLKEGFLTGGKLARWSAPKLVSG
jgi:hypothetical protein